MYTKEFCSWILGLGMSVSLTVGQVLAAPLPIESTGSLTTGWLVADADLDGVDDSVDLCPGTPAGTVVNLYGCPLTVSTCDYTTSTVTLMSAGGSNGGTVTTRYVLASNIGTIMQINPTASFTGLAGTATYMALALTYDGAVSNLTVGGSLSAVTASCLDWSNALVFKACVEPATCDYQIGDDIVLNATGGSAVAGSKTSYVLTTATGKLVRINTTPSFSSTGLLPGMYQAYALTYTDDNTITNLVVNGTTTLSQVSASCLAVSSGLLLKLCARCVTSCVPILISRLR